jgi:hypothetical protein
MEQDIKIETLAVMSALLFAVMAVVTFLVPFDDENTRFFFVALAGILAVIDVFGFLTIWRSSPTIIDEIFLMTPDGLLLKHYTRRLKPDADEDILAGMLTAVQTFIKESMDESSGRLREIKFENYDIVISNSKHVVVAAIISTKKPEKLRNQLKLVTDDIESKYGSTLAKWSGDKSELSEVDSLMKRLLGGKYRRK